ncbi:hypothetical protein ACM64Y_04165 [Novispirillum sp. DQ9]|uniref:hypothetical protein n=1 Tax=Novispirillum sp. DQ9 TaxID=3398612 RepID=UPI003C7B8AFD
MRRILTAGLIAAATTFAAAAPAQSSCFYNKSDIKVTPVVLKCSTLFCIDKKWEIPKGDYNCHAGKGGEFQVGALKGSDIYFLNGWVRDHGYVTIHGSCRTGMTVKVWEADHKLLQEATFALGLIGCE